MDGIRTADSRGQMILMGALVLAVLFVGLALVLNSAIYTENLSTRDVGGSAETLSEDQPTEERLVRSMAMANYDNDTAEYEWRRSVIDDNVSDWNLQQSDRHARTGQVASTTVSGDMEGVRVVQASDGTFTPAEPSLLEITEEDGELYHLDPAGVGGRNNWQVTPEVNTRAFQMTVDRNSLAKDQEDLLEELESLGNELLTGSDEFWAQIEGEETTHRVYLVNDTSNQTVSAVVTEIDGGEETLLGTCRAVEGGDEATIHISAAQIESDGYSEDCQELSEIDDGPHEVFYVGGDEVEGTYQVMGDKPRDEFNQELRDLYVGYLENLNQELEDDGLLGSLLDTFTGVLEELVDDPESFEVRDVYSDEPSEDGPYTTTAVYSVTVERTYMDDRVTYTRNTTFAPPDR